MILRQVFLSALIFMVGSVNTISAQQPEVEETVVAQTVDNNYIAADYSGFKFEIPAGSIVEKGTSLVAKYPDGSFGLSMTNTSIPSKQKYAYELCKRNADQMHLKHPKVEKVKYGKAAGAKATGILEGQHVTILVLPYDNQEMTTVILATPNREEWVNHFLSTLKK